MSPKLRPPTPVRTWADLVSIEPRLRNLAAQVRYLPLDEQSYVLWEAMLDELVGYGAEKDAVCSRRAYDIGHAYLLEIWGCAR